MTVGELIAALDDFGSHLTVIVEWDEDTTELFSVGSGRDTDGMTACVIRADRA